jgi:hypothetical protein
LFKTNKISLQTLKLLVLDLSPIASGCAGLWEFDREDCEEGTFPNSALKDLFGALQRNNTARTSCLGGRGVKASTTVSTDTNVGVLVESHRDFHQVTERSPLGFSVEVWGDFDSVPYSSNLMPIVTLGQSNNGEDSYCRNVGMPAMSMSFQLSVRYQRLVLVINDVSSTTVQSGTSIYGSTGNFIQFKVHPTLLTEKYRTNARTENRLYLP